MDPKNVLFVFEEVHVWKVCKGESAERVQKDEVGRFKERGATFLEPPVKRLTKRSNSNKNL